MRTPSGIRCAWCCWRAISSIGMASARANACGRAGGNRLPAWKVRRAITRSTARWTAGRLPCTQRTSSRSWAPRCPPISLAPSLTGHRSVMEHMPVEHVNVVVIGAGLAGLAIGYYLARRARRFVILEAHPRVGDSWRRRWDSLRLFTPAHFDSLPGQPFPAPPYSFPTKDQMAAYPEQYAATFRLPVRTGIRVDSLRRNEHGDGYIVVADDSQWLAPQVVVATGAYHEPRVPMFARELKPEIRQLHSSEYRNPAQLRSGGVLVVGACNSGAEIAFDVARTH